MSAKIPKLEPLEQLGMEEKLHLVNVVQAYLELWDERHPAYKDNAKRTMAWNHITGIMQDSFDKQYQEIQLFRTWGNLRDSYRRKRKHISELSAHSSGSAVSANIAVKMKSWPFYEAMSFLSASAGQGDRFCTTFKVAQSANDDDDVDIFSDEAVSHEGSLQGSQASSPSPPPTPSRERSQASTTSSWLPTTATFTNIRPLREIAKKEGARKTKQLRGGLTLASKLRTLRDLDPVSSEEWILKTEEFMIPLSRCIYELSAKPPIPTEYRYA